MHGRTPFPSPFRSERRTDAGRRVGKLASIGLEIRTSASPSDLMEFMKQDLPKWPPLVRAPGSSSNERERGLRSWSCVAENKPIWVGMADGWSLVRCTSDGSRALAHRRPRNDLIDQVRCAMRLAPHDGKSRAGCTKRPPASPARTARSAAARTVREDAALEKSVELPFYERRQSLAGLAFDLRQEGLGSIYGGSPPRTIPIDLSAMWRRPGPCPAAASLPGRRSVWPSLAVSVMARSPARSSSSDGRSCR